MDDSLTRLNAAFERIHGPTVVIDKPLRFHPTMETWSEGFEPRTRITLSLEPSEGPIEETFQETFGKLNHTPQECFEHALEKASELARQVFRDAGIPTGGPYFFKIDTSSDWAPVDVPTGGSRVREGDLPEHLGSPLGSKERIAGDLLNQVLCVNERTTEKDIYRFGEAVRRFEQLYRTLKSLVELYHLDGEGGRTPVEAAMAAVQSRSGRLGPRAKWKIDEATELKRRRANGQTNGQLAKYIQDKYNRRTSRSIEAGIAEMIASGKI